MTFTTDQLLLLIGAIGVVLVNAINAWRTNAKVDGVAAKTNLIEGHVNSAASASAAREAGFQTEIATLKEQNSSLRQLLAQATAQKDNPS